MAPDADFERHIQALLDGEPLGASWDSVTVSAAEPIRIVSAIAELHRVALFGAGAQVDARRSTWGHLEIRGEIGRGASGTVYRAWDGQLAREVALKLFEADADPAQALAEGRLLARLHHPNIVQVFGADTHDGITGIWMELLDGETLDELLASDGSFSAAETLLIGLDLAGALWAVHAAGLLHRDIKARNVLRERGGRIVLMDLGAGRTIEQPHGHRDTTGTPMYMAPEVLSGAAASLRSDIYCLGVLLFRLLTGDYPVTATTLDELRAAHASRSRASLAALRPDLGDAVIRAIERCCAPDPGDRPATAADVEAEFAQALRTIPGTHPRVRTPLQRSVTRYGRLSVRAGLVAAVIFATGWSVWDTTALRATRRRLGLPVPPLSTLYLSVNGGVGFVRRGALSVYPFNFGVAAVIAASNDRGLRVMNGMPPWVPSKAFTLEGLPVAATPTRNEGLCCFLDGTTDGRFNYAPRTDSTLLEPFGSRPLAPNALYRFDRDWAAPVMLFRLTPHVTTNGTYSGVAFSARTNSFWLMRAESTGSFLEHWSPDGALLSTVEIPSVLLAGLAIDPRDDTLWSSRSAEIADLFLENFDSSGRRLGSLRIQGVPDNPLGAWSSLEFAWGQP